MSVFLYSTLVALLALVALAGAGSLLIYRLVRGPEASNLLGVKAIWLAWLVALVATVGSLVYSEVVHFTPCRLCWFQRIAMYPMVIVLLVGAIRRDFRARYYALPLALIGLGISIYHYLLQRFPNLEATSSCDPSNPCSLVLVNIFDFVSIPFMAGAGFIVIAVLLGFYVNENNIEQEKRVQ